MELAYNRARAHTHTHTHTPLHSAAASGSKEKPQPLFCYLAIPTDLLAAFSSAMCQREGERGRARESERALKRKAAKGNEKRCNGDLGEATRGSSLVYLRAPSSPSLFTAQQQRSYTCARHTVSAVQCSAAPGEECAQFVAVVRSRAWRTSATSSQPSKPRHGLRIAMHMLYGQDKRSV